MHREPLASAKMVASCVSRGSSSVSSFLAHSSIELQGDEGFLKLENEFMCEGGKTLPLPILHFQLGLLNKKAD